MVSKQGSELAAGGFWVWCRKDLGDAHWSWQESSRALGSWLGEGMQDQMAGRPGRPAHKSVNHFWGTAHDFK